MAPFPAVWQRTTSQILKNVCRDDKLATDLIDEAVRNPIGTNQHVGVDNVHRLKRRDGNSRDHALRQLRDHRPDLHLVIAEKMSPHRAMIEAGFRSRTFTVPDDIDAAAATLKRRFRDQLPALIRAVREQIDELA
jgi:hypothetical protein